MPASRQSAGRQSACLLAGRQSKDSEPIEDTPMPASRQSASRQSACLPPMPASSLLVSSLPVCLQLQAASSPRLRANRGSGCIVPIRVAFCTSQSQKVASNHWQAAAQRDQASCEPSRIRPRRAERCQKPGRIEDAAGEPGACGNLRPRRAAWFLHSSCASQAGSPKTPNRLRNTAGNCGNLRPRRRGTKRAANLASAGEPPHGAPPPGL